MTSKPHLARLKHRLRLQVPQVHLAVLRARDDQVLACVRSRERVRRRYGVGEKSGQGRAREESLAPTAARISMSGLCPSVPTVEKSAKQQNFWFLCPEYVRRHFPLW